MDHGILNLFMFVVVSNGERPRHKKVSLCNIHCAYEDVTEKLLEFKRLNSRLEGVHATWVFSEHFALGSL